MAQQSDATPNFIEAWTNAQKAFWESWASLAWPASLLPQGGAPGWQQDLDLWQRMFVPGGGQAAAVGRSLVEQWTAYLRWGQSLLPRAPGETAAAPAATDWMAALARMFGRGTGEVTSTGGWTENDVVRGLFAFWGLPLDTWGRVIGAMSAFPGNALAMGKTTGNQSELSASEAAPFEKFLAIPPLGYARERQERGQRAMQDWLAYQGAAAAFQSILNRIGMRTTEVTQQRFAQRSVSGKPFQSLREAYDLFVDCAEEAYAEVVTAAEFGKASAELMNTLMAVKRHAQTMAEEMAIAGNLPTRRELDTSHRQLQQLKRQLRAMADDVRQSRLTVPAADARIEALGREMSALRAELGELGSRAEAAPVAISTPEAEPAVATGGKDRKTRAQREGD